MDVVEQRICIQTSSAHKAVSFFLVVAIQDTTKKVDVLDETVSCRGVSSTIPARIG